MLYFILWTVAILVVLLSIPTAHFIEVSRRKKELAALQGDAESSGEEGEVEEDAAAEEIVEMADVGDEGFEEFSGEPSEGGDDFSAFDEALDEDKN